MRKVLLFMLFFAALSAMGAVQFNETTRYRLVCKKFGAGGIGIGAYHGSTALVYYDIYARAATADAWWYIRKNGNGYTFQNAATGQYLYHESTREEQVAKGLRLCNAVTSDSVRWRLISKDSFFEISNKAVPSQYINCRTDGSYLVGTYYNADDNGLFEIFDEQGRQVKDDEQPETLRTPLSGYLDMFRLNNKDLVYDSLSGSFFFSARKRYRDGRDFSAAVTLSAQPGVTLSLDGQELSDGGTVTIHGIDCGKTYPIVVSRNGSVVASVPLQMTFLPIVEMNVSSTNQNSYTRGSIRVTDPGVTGYDSIYVADFRIRGASATNYQKKSYAVKLYDANGESKNVEFLGKRSDNNWILDAMVIDKACMRNRLSTDLWKDIHTEPYYAQFEKKKIRPYTRGEFVEVFLNGAYHGLYCMTEKIDRQQLRLKKSEGDTIHSLLYKSGQWSYEVLFGHELGYPSTTGRKPAYYSNNYDSWREWELKYPDLKKGEKIDWGPLYNAINFCATASDVEFERGIESYLDLPVLRDYYLFLDLLFAYDNDGKNMYYALYDLQKNNGQKLTIVPWDLDATWGRSWDGTNRDQGDPTADWSVVRRAYTGGLTYYNRLEQSPYLNWSQMLADRYAELRLSKKIDADSLVARITEYATLFSDSRADQREGSYWAMYHGGIQKDVEYMKKWIKARIPALDRKYNFDPTTSGLRQVSDKSYVSAAGGVGSIIFSSSAPQMVQIYTIDGRLYRTVSLTQSVETVSGIPAGLYLTAGQKVLVQ